MDNMVNCSNTMEKLGYYVIIWNSENDSNVDLWKTLSIRFITVSSSIFEHFL
jgi:hypothetical protein